MYTFEIRFSGDEEFVKHAYRALNVEAEESRGPRRLTDRYEAYARASEEELVISIKAKDISALRAAMNTYFFRMDMLIAIRSSLRSF